MENSEKYPEPLAFEEKLKRIAVSGLVMAGGLVLFKFLPQYIWGPDITFDASFHIIFMAFFLHIGWFFIDQVPNWRTPYLIIATGLLIIVAIHRIIEEAHDEFGVMLGIAVAGGAVLVAHWQYFKQHLSF